MLILILGGPRKVMRVLLCDLRGSGLGCLFLSSNWKAPQHRQPALVSQKENLNKQGEAPGFPLLSSVFLFPVLSSLPVWSCTSDPVFLFP